MGKTKWLEFSTKWGQSQDFKLKMVMLQNKNGQFEPIVLDKKIAKNSNLNHVIIWADEFDVLMRLYIKYFKSSFKLKITIS